MGDVVEMGLCTQSPASPAGRHRPGGFSPHFPYSHLGGVRRDTGEGTTGGDLDTRFSVTEK